VAVANTGGGGGHKEHKEHKEQQEQQEHGALTGLKTGESALRLVGALLRYHKPLLMSRINIDLLPMLLERMTHKIEIEIDHGTQHEKRGGFFVCDFAGVILLV